MVDVIMHSSSVSCSHHPCHHDQVIVALVNASAVVQPQAWQLIAYERDSQGMQVLTCRLSKPSGSCELAQKEVSCILVTAGASHERG